MTAFAKLSYFLSGASLDTDVAERIAESILCEHSHELAEKIRSRGEIRYPTYCDSWPAIEYAADLIDPEVTG